MSTDQIQPGRYSAFTRRTFLSTLLLAAIGCQSRPQKLAATPQPSSPSPPPSRLAREPGRLVIQSRSTDDIDVVTSIWRIRSDGTAQHQQELPPDLLAPLERVGRGERICYYVPSSQEGSPTVIRTIELMPDNQVLQRPDRQLLAFADPHLYFCEADLILASQPTDRDPYAELVFIDKAGIVASTGVELQGVVQAIASDGQHVAVLTSNVGLDGRLNFGPLILYEREQTRLTEVSALVLEALQGGKAFPTGASFFKVDNALYLSIGIEAGPSLDSAILIYKLVDGQLVLQQRLSAGSRPGPLHLANSHSAFYQNGLGQTFSYSWSPSGWEPADELRSTGFGASPQSQEPDGVVYLSNSAEQILCAPIDSQSQIGSPLPISETFSRVGQDLSTEIRYILLLVLD